MTFAIAAAGTGGHVFPGLAVAEALRRTDPATPIVFVGGDRFEATAVPEAGLTFEQVELRGLERSLTPRNLTLPAAVLRAVSHIADIFTTRRVRVLFATGGYATVPAALAARRLRLPYVLHEQNAHIGLANRLMAGRARRLYTSFPGTAGADGGEFVGNPIRRAVATLDRAAARPAALAHYGLDPERPVVGVVGGSLGSGPINTAMVAAASTWREHGVQIVHLTGRRFADEVAAAVDGLDIVWRVIGFEDRMDRFLAAADLVVSRASGMVAEFTAVGLPAVLIPGAFGSKGHQEASARIMADAGAATVVSEADLPGGLSTAIVTLLDDPAALARMGEAARRIGRPDAADVIAEELRRAAA